MADPVSVTLSALAEQTTSGSGSAVDISGGARSFVELVVTVATASAGDTLSVAIETSPDNTNWRHLTATETIVLPGAYPLVVGGCDRYVRATWTIADDGGPSFTFAVTGESHQVYATYRDMRLAGISPDALQSVPMGDQNVALLAATSEAETSLSNAYGLPLSTWGRDLTTHVARLAAYNLAMVHRHLYDELVAEGHTTAVAYFKGLRTASTVVDRTPTYAQDAAQVYSDESRGW